jgi:hypothetical protein
MAEKFLPEDPAYRAAAVGEQVIRPIADAQFNCVDFGSAAIPVFQAEPGIELNSLERSLGLLVQFWHGVFQFYVRSRLSGVTQGR